MSTPVEIQTALLKLCSGLPQILSELGEFKTPDIDIPHAPKRKPNLSKDEQEVNDYIDSLTNMYMMLFSVSLRSWTSLSN